MMADSPVKLEGGDTTTDVDEIWKAAIERYEEVAGVKFTSLASAHSVDDILNEIHEREARFKSRRHDGSRVDRFRTLVRKSLAPVDRIGEVAAQGASGVSNSILLLED